jgi:hypothetical protein
MGPCKQIASAISKAMKRRFISGSLAYGRRAVACAKSQAFPRRGRFYFGFMDAWDAGVMAISWAAAVLRFDHREVFIRTGSPVLLEQWYRRVVVSRGRLEHRRPPPPLASACPRSLAQLAVACSNA